MFYPKDSEWRIHVATIVAILGLFMTIVLFSFDSVRVLSMGPVNPKFGVVSLIASLAAMGYLLETFRRQ